MSLRHFVKHTAIATVLAAGLLGVSSVRAADLADDMQLMAFSAPVSAPCHISQHACAKPERIGTKGSAAVYPTDRSFEPVSAPCHPALKACRS